MLKTACFINQKSRPESLLITDRRLLISVLGRPGGHSEEPLPDPIPNSAVKVLCADGTKPQGLEE
jgi:hypothetical protein